MKIVLQHTQEYDIDDTYVVDALPDYWDDLAMYEQEDWVIANGGLLDTESQPGEDTLYNIAVEED